MPKPTDPKHDRSLDYRRDRLTESGAPEKYAWYGDALIASTERLTKRDRLRILETHPLFTGRCPRCDLEYGETAQDWDCVECGWQDERVD